MFCSSFTFLDKSVDHQLNSDKHSPNLIRFCVLLDLLVNHCHISEEFVRRLCIVCLSYILP
jgi:hypothetical protein